MDNLTLQVKVQTTSLGPTVYNKGTLEPLPSVAVRHDRGFIGHKTSDKVKAMLYKTENSVNNLSHSAATTVDPWL